MLIRWTNGKSPIGPFFALAKGQKYENIFMAIKKKTHAIIKSIMISKFMRNDNLEKER